MKLCKWPMLTYRTTTRSSSRQKKQVQHKSKTPAICLFSSSYHKSVCLITDKTDLPQKNHWWRATDKSSQLHMLHHCLFSKTPAFSALRRFRWAEKRRGDSWRLSFRAQGVIKDESHFTSRRSMCMFELEMRRCVAVPPSHSRARSPHVYACSI